MPNVPTHARVVIVGGGIVGCSAAYHLAKAGWREIVLLEQNQIAGGTTWHAAGMVTRLRTSSAQAALNDHSAKLYARLAAETGHDPQWRQVGSLLLARTPARVTQLRRTLGVGKVFGIESNEMSPDEARRYWPDIHTGDLIGAFFLPDDGRVEPAETARALAKGAELSGATLLEGVRVVSVTTDGRRITGVQTPEGDIQGEIVLLCGGMWTRQIGLDLGCDLPLYPVEHHYAETASISGIHDDLPCTRDYDGSIYFRAIGDKIRFGAFQAGTKPWSVDRVPDDFSFQLFGEDWQTFASALDEFHHRFPALGGTPVDRFVNGPESFTPDGACVLGPVAGRDNLYVAAGFNSFGIAGAGGAGWAIAEWIQSGEAPFDLWEVDPRRFGPALNDTAFLQQRTPEVLGHHYGIAWPSHEFTSGRDVRLSPIHARTSALGACYGQRFGWERPLWYDKPGQRPRLTYSFDRPHWFANWEAEHHATRELVALFDLSSFGKYRLSGPDALSLLNWLCGAEIDVPIGRVVYTGLFNAHGRFVSDLTIIRQDTDDFLIITAAAQTLHDFDWIDRQARQRHARVTLEDVSTESAVLGLMGPRSRHVLQSLADNDWSNETFPFGTTQTISIADTDILAVRISYVGELGWELHIPSANAIRVFDDLVLAGSPSGLRMAGMTAQNSLRMEKSYVSWGHDVSLDDTPLEAGLGFAISWDKPGGFLGRDALLRQRDEGVPRRLLTFVLDDPTPLLWGREPIFRDGRPVGYTTSGSYAHTLGAAIGMGYVPVDADTAEVTPGQFEIGVAETRCAATPHLRAPYDPRRQRILS